METGGGAAQSGLLLLLMMIMLRGILAGDWSVRLPSGPICAVIGSTVVIPCSYDFPQSSNETGDEGRPPAQGGGGDVLSEMWCLESSRCITPRYVFHSAGILLDPSYQNRVEYLGQPGSKNCSLRISNLRQSDSGTYVFYLIARHLTEKMPEQSGVQLLVGDSLNAVTVSSSPPSDIAEGGAVRLACCSPAAGPQAHFTWYKRPDPRPGHRGQVWNISGLIVDDSGSYYCQIETGDKVQNSSGLSIDVKYPPRNTVITVSPDAELHNGLPVTLTCSSDANPPVHAYSWYQGEACLPMADKSFYPVKQSVALLTGRGRTLTVSNITTVEPGQHCCLARNRQGSQTYSVTLRGSRATGTSESSGGKMMIIGVTIGVLLAIIAIVALILTRRKKSSRNQSYVLTATSAPEP